MTMTETDIYKTLVSNRTEPGTMLDQMVEYFRESRRPMELFEALKMRTRHQLGLPLVQNDEEPSRPEEVEQQLEAGLLDACREAGTMLIKDGRVGEGWMYLRPTGDTELAQQLIADAKITDDNFDEMIQVLLHEGIDVKRGFQAVLDHQGTCNSITLFEQTLQTRSESDRRATAECLLNHLYAELCELVRGDIANREAPAGDNESLHDMISTRKWIMGEGGYHLDTTHLASTVRIAAVLESKEHLQKAWELTQYGRQLNHQLQYPGDEPFVDFYPAYAAFYGTLLGNNVDAGLKMFERKAKSVNTADHGTGAIETYVDLLDRVGRRTDAVKAAVELVPDDVPPQRIVPLLIGIAERAKADGDAAAFEEILGYCQKHDDILGYAAVLHSASAG